ncbi:Hypothetical protein GbCGDNIH7_5111 [Granulibacter bethesdensis]|nr:Hypothetical protein GbCGDNIH7_5111 [Granulibacter bethesdensis]
MRIIINRYFRRVIDKSVGDVPPIRTVLAPAGTSVVRPVFVPLGREEQIDKEMFCSAKPPARRKGTPGRPAIKGLARRLEARGKRGVAWFPLAVGAVGTGGPTAPI